MDVGCSTRAWKLGSAGLAGVGAIVVASSGAHAAPREALAFTNVVSWGEAGDPHNVVAERALVGGYGVGSVRVSATLSEVANATFASDSRLFISAPLSQGSLVVQPFTTDAFTGSISVAGLHLASSGTWALSAGLWRVRFYELFTDNTSGPDAVWQSIEVVLDDEPLDQPTTLTPVAGVYQEVEGNSEKTRANRVEGILPGERIQGQSTGAAVSGDGLATADYFRIASGPAPIGVYRHRLVVSSDTPGHLVGLRGLTQSNGFVAPGSDTVVQAASESTQPARFVQWYGFGRQERVVLRVAGLPETTAPYWATFERESVTTPDLGRFVGEVTISSQGRTSVDTDLWLYDEDLRAVPGAGNDDGVVGVGTPRQSRLARQLPPGFYFLAIGDFNLANDQPSPNDDVSRSGPVLEFADVVLNGSQVWGMPLDFGVWDSRGRLVETAYIKPGPFDVGLFRFEVVEACAADRTGAGTPGEPDGAVLIDDLLYYLEMFEAGVPEADVDDGSLSGTRDGGVTIDDLLYFLARFEAGC